MLSTVFLGADHAGLDLKMSVYEHLLKKGYTVEDLGAHEEDPDDDYPTYAKLVGHALQDHKNALGILICGSAEGVCIAANKLDDIRAGIGFSVKAAISLRKDDHGNILCLPARLATIDDPLSIVDAFLETVPSEEARHLRRVNAIDDLENSL